MSTHYHSVEKKHGGARQGRRWHHSDQINDGGRLGRDLDRRRAALGWSRGELARAAGIGDSFTRAILAGRMHGGRDTRAKLLKAIEDAERARAARLVLIRELARKMRVGTR